MYLASSKVTIKIVNTNLTNNTACRGGNMAVLFYDFASVAISNTLFNKGHSSEGGGMYVFFMNPFHADNYYENMKAISASKWNYVC